MSKLLDAIQAQISCVRRVEEEPFRGLTAQATYMPMGLEIRRQYLFKMTIERKVFMHPTEDLGEVMKMVRQSIAEEVFGEFRANLLAITEAAYNGDHKAIVAEVSKIQNSMFNP